MSLEIEAVPGRGLAGSARELQAAPHRFVAEAALRRGGLARFRVGPRRFVACASAESVRHVLVDRHDNYPRSKLRLNGALVLGSGLIFNEGEEWLARRRAVVPAFRAERLASLPEIARDEAEKMGDVWASQGGTGDLLQDTQRLTLNVIARALLSERPSHEEAAAFGAAVRESVQIIRTRNLSVLPLPAWVPTRGNRRLAEVRAALDAYVERHLSAAERPEDLLAALQESGMDRRGLRDETKTLFVAGFETTAATLAWCLYLLAREPETGERLRDDAETGGEDYAGAVAHEGLRLYPPVYTIPREAAADDDLTGRRVRRGDLVLVSAYGLQRNPDHWSEPDAFRPERFLPGQPWDRSAFLPFGLGKHRCVGNVFAMVELVAALRHLACRFQIALPDGFDPGESAYVTLTPAREIPLRVVPR